VLISSHYTPEQAATLARLFGDGNFIPKSKVGDQIYHLESGGSVYGLRLIPHTWHCVSTTPGRVLVISQPAGHVESFVEDVVKLTPAH
jgi:hypothetical protein